MTISQNLLSRWCMAGLLAAALLSMPTSARAQLYVSSGGTVGEYDATTGAPINANLIPGAGGTMALSGNTLFVIKYIYPFNYNLTGLVGAYNATTGATIGASFVNPSDEAGLEQPTALAVSGNRLFVTSITPFEATVGAYDASTGATINAHFIAGLGNPRALAVSGNTLFVMDGSTVGEYNATTGAVINPNFITWSSPQAFEPTRLAVSDNTLFVSDFHGRVGAYNATTGADVNPSFITGLINPNDLAVSGNALYVANVASDTVGTGYVGEYDATTGAPINARFITGLTGPELAVSPVPEPSPWPMMAGAGVALSAVGLCRRRRRRLAGVLAACYLAFSPALKADVTVETFTDYNAFLNLLGPTAQVVNFDDVPTPTGTLTLTRTVTPLKASSLEVRMGWERS